MKTGKFWDLVKGDELLIKALIEDNIKLEDSLLGCKYENSKLKVALRNYTHGYTDMGKKALAALKEFGDDDGK